MLLPKLLVFASGGGSGFEKLVNARNSGVLRAQIVGLVVNRLDIGAVERAQRLCVPCYHFKKPWDAQGYRRVKEQTCAEFCALSGWLKPVDGLDPCTTINIHPGPLTEREQPDHFGGQGMYGHFVHEAVLKAFKARIIKHTQVCMHFVIPSSDGDNGVDDGPVFYRQYVRILPGDTADTLAARVNQVEHANQARITNMVVNGMISWDGVNPTSLVLPDGYDVDHGEMHVAGII